MKFPVLNKPPSKKALERASKMDAPEAANQLAIATWPRKGELWKRNATGDVFVILSNDVLITHSNSRDAGECYGYVYAHWDGSIVNFEQFMPLNFFKNFKKIGRVK